MPWPALGPRARGPPALARLALGRTWVSTGVRRLPRTVGQQAVVLRRPVQWVSRLWYCRGLEVGRRAGQGAAGGG